LDDVRASGRRVIATCWYVADFLEANPAYRDLRAA
jgi:predicted GNAT family acetyltransferase